MPYPLYRPSFAPSVAPAEVGELLHRYPNLREEELARLGTMLSKVPPLDMSLMLADERLLPRLEAFYTEHRDKLASPWAENAVIAAILLLPLMIAVSYLLAEALS